MFPKDRNGFSGQGNKDANFIDRLTDAPFLKRRRPAIAGRPGSTAIKKNGFLEVRLDKPPVVAVEPLPFLWAMLPTTTGTLGYRRFGWGARPTRDNANVLRNPAFVPSGREFYVGDGYILALNHDGIPIDGTDSNPVEDTWLSLIKVGNGATEVLSLSAENVPGANVSFHDVALLPSRTSYWEDSDTERPTAFVTGWDADAGGYGFGFIGREVLRPEPSISSDFDDGYALVCWYGNTATRTLTRVDLRGPDFYAMGNFVACTVGRGKVMALVTQPGLAYPTPPKALRTYDHGRTWTMEPVPELVPHLLRTAGGYATDTAGFALPGMGYFHAQPIGGGRIAAIVCCGKDFDTAQPSLATPPGWGTGEPFSYYTRWRFFVSDETGHNFVNQPWPADAWLGYNGLRRFYSIAVDDWLEPLLSMPLPPSLQTAGQGTAFRSVFEFQRNTSGAVPVLAPRRARVLFTLNGGASWGLSPYLPDAAITDQVTSIEPITARPYVDADRPGEIYLLSVTAAGVIRIHKTTALFAAFEQVYEQSVPNFYLGNSLSHINGVFIGNAPGYPVRMLPGYLEFQKP